MTARVKYLIKDFEFEELNRGRIVLGTNVRLNPNLNWLQLKEQSDGTYPTADDLFAKTWVAYPTSVKRWIGFEVEAVHPEVEGQVVTSLGFRLGDGTSERKWNGSSWVVASSGWNTEAEVSANIGSFPVSAKKIQVIINLKTTDATVSPVVKRVKVLFESDVEFMDDIIFRSLIRSLRESVRPIADFKITLATTGATIDLANTYRVETPYNIVGIDSVYNDTDDPNHATDLFLSFNPATKIITLTGSVTAGKNVFIRFVYEPEVAMSTSQDYSEIAKVPVIIIENVRTERMSEIGSSDWVLNSHNYQGKKIVTPIRGDIVGNLHVMTDKAVDLFRLTDELKRFFQNTPKLRSRGLDEEYRLWMTEEFTLRSSELSSDIHAGNVGFRIVDVLFFTKDAVDVFAVQRFRLTGDMDVTIGLVGD